MSIIFLFGQLHLTIFFNSNNWSKICFEIRSCSSLTHSSGDFEDAILHVEQGIAA